MIYKHNFSPHRYSIWNNRDILYKNRSLFFKGWFNNNIIWVHQLFNHNGVLFNYREFLQHVQIPVTPREFAIVFDAIPSGVQMLFKNYVPAPAVALLSLVTDLPIGKVCFNQDNRKNNCEIRALFQSNIVSVSSCISFWNSHVEGLPWKKIWTLSQKFFVVNKVKEVSFKIIHRCYPVKSFFVKFKEDIDASCAFCDAESESLEHLFWKCAYSHELWKDIIRFISSNILPDFELKLENVLFGVVHFEAKYVKEYYLINLIILIAKFYIHKCKFSIMKPRFIVFLKEIELYIKTISLSTNRKALKTVTLCSHFNVFC